VGALFVLALLGAGLQMVEPLFMRYIVDHVLLQTGLDPVARRTRLNVAGALFFALIVLSNLSGAFKDYQQRLLNTRVMLALRRALFERLLHLPLAKLWDMKTGGILSRLTGDVDTTTGLMQMAIVSPSVSIIRLVIAVVVLMSLNWRLALAALAIVPGVMLISFIFAKRVRPIYRAVRKDAELIDGRVGETFSGIRVVRAFRREIHELLDYMLGRHTVLRKEMFAQRREMVIWTSWNLLLGIVNVAIVWYGGYLNLRGGASIGDIMAFQWYTFLLLNPVWNLVNSFSELQRSLAATERVFEVIGDNGASARQWLELPTHCRQRAPSKADIQFECHERGRLIQAIGSLVASAMTYGDRCRRGARVRSCIDESTFTLAVHNDGDTTIGGLAVDFVSFPSASSMLGSAQTVVTSKLRIIRPAI
jgi:ATP-binding cassette subfamily B protein/subfamily B ATP-binding cassette protein MsbA